MVAAHLAPPALPRRHVVAEALAGERGKRADHVAGEPVRIAGRLHPRDQGGEFGVKAPFYREPILVCHMARKLGAALAAGLTPILCVGETLDAREAGDHESVVAAQIDSALAGGDAEDVARMVLAYEPVWAIGTGVNATPEQANEMHAFIRNLLDERFGAETAGMVPILYGGSVNPANAGALMSQPEINGSLVGGASLKSETLLPIIEHSLT